jgi:hypothetical protein
VSDLATFGSASSLRSGVPKQHNFIQQTTGINIFSCHIFRRFDEQMTLGSQDLTCSDQWLLFIFESCAASKKKCMTF